MKKILCVVIMMCLVSPAMADKTVIIVRDNAYTFPYKMVPAMPNNAPVQNNQNVNVYVNNGNNTGPWVEVIYQDQWAQQNGNNYYVEDFVRHVYDKAFHGYIENLLRKHSANWVHNMVFAPMIQFRDEKRRTREETSMWGTTIIWTKQGRNLVAEIHHAQ